MENLPNNLRGTVAQLEGIELRRPQNLYMHMTRTKIDPAVRNDPNLPLLLKPVNDYREENIWFSGTALPGTWFPI